MRITHIYETVMVYIAKPADGAETGSIVKVKVGPHTYDYDDATKSAKEIARVTHRVIEIHAYPVETTKTVSEEHEIVAYIAP